MVIPKHRLMRLIVEAGFVAKPGGELYEDAAILIEDGIITAIDRRVRLANLEADRIGGYECLALPGFVNSHQDGRAESTVGLGAGDAPLECWLISLLAIPRSDPYVGTVRLCRRCTAAGIATAVHSHYSTARTLEGYDTELRAILAGYRDGGVRGIVAAGLRDQGVPVFGETRRFVQSLPGELREIGHWSSSPQPYLLTGCFGSWRAFVRRYKRITRRRRRYLWSAWATLVLRAAA
jgi:cytosine/adenosine deaminase-related metal-dependent hydrolase